MSLQRYVLHFWILVWFLGISICFAFAQVLTPEWRIVWQFALSSIVSTLATLIIMTLFVSKEEVDK